MSGVSAISSNLMMKSTPLYTLSSTAANASSLLQPFHATTAVKIGQLRNSRNRLFVGGRVIASNLSDHPRGPTPPEFPSTPHTKPHLPSELPRSPNFPDFDPIPPEKIADPPPLSPRPKPDFPGPPMPSPPLPHSPRPPMPCPPGPDIPPGPPNVFPPRAPEIIPPKLPEVGLPRQTSPDIPTPLADFSRVISVLGSPRLHESE